MSDRSVVDGFTVVLLHNFCMHGVCIYLRVRVFAYVCAYVFEYGLCVVCLYGDV